MLIVPEMALMVASGIPSPRDRTWAMSVDAFPIHFQPVKLKPLDVCHRCNHTQRQHWHAFTEACGVAGCRCDQFQPEQEIVDDMEVA
jgi:hypothetical protein